jgi:RNase P/RNase MRP subunit POP5
MKNLKPSHREKKRYLLIKGKDANKKIFEEVVLEFIGVLGYAESSPQLIKSKENNLIISINRDSLNKIRSAILISGKDLNIVKVSGSVSKLKD